VITRGLAAYVGRDWAAAREAKDAYWARIVRERGALAALQIAGELRLQTLQLHPDWPTTADRCADFQAHERLCGLLQRGSGSRCR
jgi:hypothetical protein